MENFVVTKKKFAAVVASIICVIALIIVSCIAINSAKKPKKVSTVANVSEVKEKKSSSVIDEASESVSEASSVPQINSSVAVETSKSVSKASDVSQINSSGSGQSSVISGTSEVSSIADTGSIDESALSRRSALLNVAFLAQKPELPTGCEITSLTTVLNFYGYGISKTEMAKNYLAKQPRPADWRKVFVGDPTDPHSFGCYAAPITDAANKFFSDNGNKYVATNKSGSNFTLLLKEVNNGRPVVLWGTISLKSPYKTVTWDINGEKIQWTAPEHCYVLIGYDLDRNVAVISDPLRGIMEYNLQTVKSRYESLYSQCVFITENSISEN